MSEKKACKRACGTGADTRPAPVSQKTVVSVCKGNVFVGIDMHKITMQVAAVDSEGKEVFNFPFPTDHKTIKRVCSYFPKDAKYVMESSSVWYGAYRYMTEDLKLDVIVYNPYQTKAIAASKKKTDKVDARILAQLLRGGYIAQCYVPPVKIVEGRPTVRHRRSLVETQPKFKNQIHGILLQAGVHIKSGLLTSKSRTLLESMNDYQINSYLKQIDSLSADIRSVEKEMDACNAADPYAPLLLTMPGVGRVTAMMSSVIGDISRFPHSDNLVAYVGLAPSVRNSAETVHHGHITKRGDSMARHVLVEAALSHRNHAKDKSSIVQFYKRKVKKLGKSKARVAMAAKLLRAIYHTLRENRGFELEVTREQCTRKSTVDVSSRGLRMR